ncbi:MAG: PAS domain-containing protein [Candidatus Thiodiazotropha sp.]
MRISGFSESEPIGKQHSVIRHPDMPRGVFKKRWETIARGEKCFAYVNNLCRKGDHYRALANFSPDFDGRGEIRVISPCGEDRISKP